MTNFLFCIQLLFIPQHWHILQLILFFELLPDLLIPAYFVRQFFEKHGVVVTKLVSGKDLKVNQLLI
jgi:hypothetical protein